MLRLAAVACAIAALVAAGCGSSSKTQSSASTSTSSPAAAPLTKAQYEQKLGPVLNDQVTPALKAAFANGGASDPNKLGQALSALRTAHDSMAAVTPPAEVADLHKQAVAILASMISDTTKLKDAETSHDSSREQAAAAALKGDAQQIESVGNQLTARGY